jgi:uncharacterized protein (DUF885 family)
MKDFQNYSKDLLKLNPTLKFMYGFKDKDTLSKIENSLDDNYLKRLKKISDKYRGSTDKELLYQIESIDFYLNNKLYLLLFSSVDNFIISFNYSTNHIYPENEIYKLSRQRDFDIYIHSVIEKAKEGIKFNITFPKIIIKKFLNQIKHLEKYNKLYKFIKHDYLPFCRNEIGLCYLKNGKEIYKGIIKEYLGNLDITPEEIYQLGMNMSKNKITINDIYKSRDELFQDAIKYSSYIYDNIIDKYFHYKMDKPFVIKPVPDELEKMSPLGYYNDTEKSVFINLSYYNEVNKSELYSLLLHECFHYYHFSFMIFYNVPKYKYYIYSNDALAEGFAHYMETYNENYDENNINTLLRKLRLIVDVGINYYGWTYKQAYDYLNKYLPNRKTDNINEIDRYICMPGQALSYLIGKLNILKLRDNYKGDIKDFHHELLINGMKKFN